MRDFLVARLPDLLLDNYQVARRVSVLCSVGRHRMESRPTLYHRSSPTRGCPPWLSVDFNMFSSLVSMRAFLVLQTKDLCRWSLVELPQARCNLLKIIQIPDDEIITWVYHSVPPAGVTGNGSGIASGIPLCIRIGRGWRSPCLHAGDWNSIVPIQRPAACWRSSLLKFKALG